MLQVRKIDAFYGANQALFQFSMTIADGGAVSLLGRNGMGKTTMVNAIMGIVESRGGAIVYNGENLRGLPPYRIAQKGIGLVPEGRQIFPNLSVRENLIAAANRGHYRGAKNAQTLTWDLARVLDLFPTLKSRLARMGGQLSGGEQQMLATARALMLNPRLLILDEATEGLAPLVQQELWQKLHEIKQSGVSLLLIDKNLDQLTQLADHHYLIEKGALVWHGDSARLNATPDLREKYLGV